MPSERMTERTLTALKASETIWDSEVRGLGARRRVAGGDVQFVFKFRSPTKRDATGRGVQHLLTIGRWGRGDYGIDTARKAATSYRDAIRLGKDPAEERDARKAVPTVAELCDAYMDALPTLLLRRQRRPKKASTVASDLGRISGHIKPLLGSLPADTVTRKDITKFMHDVAAGKTAKREKLAKKRALSNVRGGQGVATRTVGLLGAIFTYGVNEGIRTDNPVRGVTRFADKKRDRRLSDDEYHKLGLGLDRAEADGVNSTGIAAARLLILTGWRTADATKLLWTAIDAPRRVARLEDSKSDASVRPLASAALELIEAQPRTSNPHVFPARIDQKSLQGFPRMWNTIREKAGLPEDITPHILRHSFMSLASDLGYNDAVVGSLVGHGRHGTTAGYIHLSDAVVLRAADAVVDETLSLMAGKGRDADAPSETP